MPNKNMKSIKRPKAYEALKDQGYSKSKAAAISNAGSTHKKRVTMAKKAAFNRRTNQGRRGNGVGG